MGLLTRLQSSIFGSWFSFGLPAFFWLYMNRGEYTASWKKMILTVLNLGCVGIAGLIVRLPCPPLYAHYSFNAN